MDFSGPEAFLEELHHLFPKTTVNWSSKHRIAALLLIYVTVLPNVVFYLSTASGCLCFIVLLNNSAGV